MFDSIVSVALTTEVHPLIAIGALTPMIFAALWMIYRVFVPADKPDPEPVSWPAPKPGTRVSGIPAPKGY